MKVLAAVPNYPPGSRVGAWLATHGFLRHLAGAGHDVTVYAYKNRTPGGWALDGVEVQTGIRGRTHGITLARAADVVVSHAGDGGYGLEVAGAARRPAVRMVHGHGYDGIGDADLVVFNSCAAAAAADHPGPAIVAHPPVDLARWAAVDRSAATAVTLVNLTRDKGVMTFWHLAEAAPHLECLGVRGGYGQQVIPRARNVEVVDTLHDMAPIYARTRILLMPSAHETWGMVGVEAMAAGIPVIAHPADGLVESLGAAGTFVHRERTDLWTAAVEALADARTYAAASARARQRAAELEPGPSLARFAAALEDIAA